MMESVTSGPRPRRVLLFARDEAGFRLVLAHFIWLALVLGLSVSAFAQSHSQTIIHAFTPAPYGENPASALIQASDGNLYGTTPSGGATGGYGTVFRISNPGGTPVFSVIHSFAGGIDGMTPVAALVQASDGNLYGTTSYGGLAGTGTVFRISNLSGTPTESVIYSFTGGGDGIHPHSSLIQGDDGNLYGTTYNGGSFGGGTVFRISSLASTAVESVVYSFSGGSDGSTPSGPVIQGLDGNLYGTTQYGGSVNVGTVFRISGLADTPTESVIYSFTGGADGGYPVSGVIQASDGRLYGTTPTGGEALFRVSDPGGAPTFEILFSFFNSATLLGDIPQGSPIQASDGKLYGTTYYGGLNFAGTIYAVSDLDGTPAVGFVVSLPGGTDAKYPAAPLVQTSDGGLYGTTSAGGGTGYGTVYKVNNLETTPTADAIFSFAGGVDGIKPSTSLVETSDGSLYGTTEYGGTGTSCGASSGCGTVFRIVNFAGNPVESVIYSFEAQVYGGSPTTSLIQGADGNLYGATAGTIFRVGNLAGTPVVDVIYTFGGPPDAGGNVLGLVQASDGNLYGTTTSGGTADLGAVFKIGNLAGTPTESVLYSFTGGSDGGTPSASVIQAADSSLYGTTTVGGANNAGTIFKISGLNSVPSFVVIHDFELVSSYASLIQASDGSLYGVDEGGEAGLGAVFRITNLAGTPTFSLVYSFTGGADGAAPLGALVQASDGNLYGTTSGGGANNAGTVFSIGNLAGTPTKSVIHNFTGRADGGDPLASLIQASDGNLYGTGSEAGLGGSGVVFRIALGGGGGGSNCTPDSHTLCLNNGRFQVQAQWTDFNGNTGVGTVVPGATSSSSGVMWFFSPANWELLIKVLDGCGVNGHYWVFGAAATNVQYTIQVTDTLTGQVNTYANPLGTVSPAITDSTAFGGACP